MKNLSFFLLGLSSLATSTSLLAQATGNETYNDNNRFKNNGYYRSESMSAAPAAARYDDAEVSGNMSAVAMKNKRKMAYSNQQYYQAGIETSQGDLLLNQVQNNQSSYYDGSDFLVRVHVLYNAAPSSYMAIFHLNQAGKKVQDIDSLMSKRVSKLIQQSHSIGLKKEDFYTDMIALVPIFEKEKKTFGKNYTQVPKGFEMQKNLHVRYKNAAQLDALFTLAAQCEIYDLIKVEYFYDSTEMANQMLKSKAVQVLNQKLKTYKQMGISLDTNFRMVQEQRHQYFPIDEYMPYQPLAVSTLEADENTDPNKTGSTTPVTTQRTTMFYNQVSTDGFDAVINPSPLTPSIQFVYNLDVRYKIQVPIQTKTETIKQTDLLIITPQGTIKEISK
ncbi:MAG: hypothetical protein EBR94_08530 [Bacteroidetes bacterium]|jgi:hypothetical protein|nr:hypothetical protein [Bacteroidota bacterium]